MVLRYFVADKTSFHSLEQTILGNKLHTVIRLHSVNIVCNCLMDRNVYLKPLSHKLSLILYNTTNISDVIQIMSPKEIYCHPTGKIKDQSLHQGVSINATDD